MILVPWLSIPSPSDPLIFELGIFKLRWYGTLIAIARMLATRKAAQYYEKSTGHLPPELQKDDQDADKAEAPAT